MQINVYNSVIKWQLITIIIWTFLSETIKFFLLRIDIANFFAIQLQYNNNNNKLIHFCYSWNH